MVNLFSESAISRARIPPGFMMLLGSKCLLRALKTSIRFSDLAFQPGGEQFPYPVVVAYGGPRSLDGVKDTPVIVHELVPPHPSDEDEVEIGPLRIEVETVRHADRPGPALAVFPDVGMDIPELLPDDGAFKGIDDNAEILQDLPRRVVLS